MCCFSDGLLMLMTQTTNVLDQENCKNERFGSIQKIKFVENADY